LPREKLPTLLKYKKREMNDERYEVVEVKRKSLPSQKSSSALTTISVIIPTLDEGTSIERALSSARAEARAEIIVCEGAKSSRSAQLAKRFNARWMSATPGRAHQMNAAAEIATGDVLLFLHSDTILPRGYGQDIIKALSDPATVAGAFSHSIEGDELSLRLVSRLVKLRCRLFSLPYGDQAIFVRRRVFLNIGGFKEAPFLEDLDLIRRLKKCGRIAALSSPAVTSSRRWKEVGTLKTTLINQMVLLGYAVGFPEEKLARFYRSFENGRSKG